MLVGVEAGVLAVLGDVDSRAERRSFEAGEAVVEPILEGVGHGDELGVGIGGECLLGGAAAPAAAADESDLDRVAAGGMDQRDGQAGREVGGRRGNRRALQEIAAGGSQIGGSRHRSGLRRVGAVVHGRISSGMGKQAQFLSCQCNPFPAGQQCTLHQVTSGHILAVRQQFGDDGNRRTRR